MNRFAKIAAGAAALGAGAYYATGGKNPFTVSVTTPSTLINPPPVIIKDAKPLPAPAPAGPNYGGLNPKDFVTVKVKEVKPYNHNTKVYALGLEDPNAVIDWPLTSYVVARSTIDGKPVARPYTPIHTQEKGVVNLLVKSYPTGVLSKRFGELKAGDAIEIRGPSPKYKYEPNSLKEAIMIAGGTGITPMLQLAEGILKNPADKTKVSIVFGNVEEKDILLKQELDSLVKQYPGRVNVKYTLDKPPAKWGGLSGYLNADLLKTLLPAPSADTRVFVCGPPGMMTAISGPKAPDYSQGEVDGALKQLGWTKDNVYKF